jgi:hypothetical protein
MSDLSLLMVHADDHEPVIEDMGGDAVRVGQVEDAMPDHLWDEGGDPNDLYAQRWGVIAPEGPRGDRLLALVEPLVRHRREQQGGEPPQIYRVPPAMTQSEAAVWRKHVFDPQRDADIELPRYQLVLGDLDEVSLALQQIQATDSYVGRLAFPDDAGYEAYVDKLLRWEQHAAPQAEGRAIFYTVHDRTTATSIGHDALVRPCLEASRQRLERGQLNADALVDAGPERVPDPDHLVGLARTDRPAMLLSLSHGEGPPRAGWPSDEHQRRCQGGMSFGRRGQLRGEDLVRGAFMPGGVWLMMACFGAGSPTQSAYHPWLVELQTQGGFRGDPRAVLDGIPSGRPFVARLPQAALANPDGPLAFLGHMDLAWTYSFRELDGGAQTRAGKFVNVLRSVLKRDRIGIGIRELYRYCEQTNAELLALESEVKAGRIASDAALATRRSHLWMLREDLSAYVLLGDPAARLPLRDPSVAALAGPAPPVVFAGAPGGTAEPVRLPLPIEELERAIGAMLLGDEGLRVVAERHGIDRSELRRLYERYSAGGRAALGVDDE